jgi:hypothetical protein
MQADGSIGAFEITVPNLNAVQIQALVRNMDASMRRHKKLKRTNPQEYRKKLEEENQTLYTYYIAIFEMHMEGKLDETFFEMLKLKQKIEKGEITEDEASRLVGQKLFSRFVSPVVGESGPSGPLPLSYEEYYKQFNKKDERI